MSYYAKTQNRRLIGYYKIYNVQLDVQSDASRCHRSVQNCIGSTLLMYCRLYICNISVDSVDIGYSYTAFHEVPPPQFLYTVHMLVTESDDH